MLNISRIVITMILTRVTDGSSILRCQLVGRNTVILRAHCSKCQRSCRINDRKRIRFCLAPGSQDLASQHGFCWGSGSTGIECMFVTDVPGN